MSSLTYPDFKKALASFGPASTKIEHLSFLSKIGMIFSSLFVFIIEVLFPLTLKNGVFIYSFELVTDEDNNIFSG